MSSTVSQSTNYHDVNSLTSKWVRQTNRQVWKIKATKKSFLN